MSELDEIDRAALRLAMARCAEQGEFRAEQLRDKLKTEPWEEVAKFAAFVAQSVALKLKPWECPPCATCDGEDNAPHGRLLARMLALGISPWHPDPLAAIAEVRETAESRASPSQKHRANTFRYEAARRAKQIYSARSDARPAAGRNHLPPQAGIYSAGPDLVQGGDLGVHPGFDPRSSGRAA